MEMLFSSSNSESHTLANIQACLVVILIFKDFIMPCTAILSFIWDFTRQGTSQLLALSSSQGLFEADVLVTYLQVRKGSKIRGLI